MKTQISFIDKIRIKSILIVMAAISVVSFDSRATIYGDLDLKDVVETNAFVMQLARSVAVQMSKNAIDRKPYLSRKLRNAMVCENEPFIDQPVVGNCTGILVSPQHILTAGHCYMGGTNPCKEFSWVFDFKLEHRAEKSFSGHLENVYNCKKMVDIKYNGDLDYALIELDRPVIDRAPLKLSAKKDFNVGDEVFAIHSPRGLPLKHSTGFIRETDAPNSLLMAIDLMRGSSGAPIFDAKTGEVIALVAQGDSDYDLQEEPFCNKYKRCADWECRGERGTKVMSVPLEKIQ